MKKYIMATLMLVMLVIPPGLRAQEMEEKRPDGIAALNHNVQTIDSAFEDAKSVSLPTEAKILNAEEDGAVLGFDHILDSIMKPANRNKIMDLDFEETTLENIFRTIEDIAEI